MIHISLICVGKIKENYFTAAIQEYAKRLQRYCKLSVIEVKDEATPDAPSPREEEQILAKEGQRILEKIPSSAHVTALCIEGKPMSSQAFAASIADFMANGVSQLAFVIGGSLGLSDAVKRRADQKLSFSPMTFPHQLMRVVLLEQIYRAMNINHGGKYHK